MVEWPWTRSPSRVTECSQMCTFFCLMCVISWLDSTGLDSQVRSAGDCMITCIPLTAFILSQLISNASLVVLKKDPVFLSITKMINLNSRDVNG